MPTEELFYSQLNLHSINRTHSTSVDIRKKNSWLRTPLQRADGTRITLMRMTLKLLAILCLLLLVSASERRSCVDLTAVLQSPAVLQRMSVMWEYPPNAALYAYGDGRLILQSYPLVSDLPDAPFVMRNRGLVPTCRTKIGVDTVKALIGLMIEKHFFDLPEKNYQYVTAAYERRKIELHTIAIDNGKEVAVRTFGVGKWQGKDESLPANFVAIEDEFAKVRDAAFPPNQRPCGIAPGIKFGSEIP